MAVSHKLCLPKTKFPLRINPSVHEPAIQKAADFESLYRWQRERCDAKGTFTLHDGPPYANGEPHIGHALNKVLKDIVVRYKVLKGYRVHHRPGWDCHGLPIELKACKDLSLRGASPLEIRQTAARYARETIELQKDAFKRWGVLADWNNPYITMAPEYEANQIQVFREMFKKGCIYRGFKPVYWSPSSGTALAEAELEYRTHTSRAIYVKFPLVTPMQAVDSSDRHRVSALVWTTTPWTLLTNRAVCYNPTHDYCVIRWRHGEGAEELLLVGAECVDALRSVLSLGDDLEVVSVVPGTSLAGTEYVSPLEGGDVVGGMRRPFLPGGHVTAAEGTGLVHTSPAHGFEDYAVGVTHGLDLECLVDGEGRFAAKVGGTYAGLSVLEEGTEAVIDALRSCGHLVSEAAHAHRYPYDWRTKKPVIIRSTNQWFASVAALKAGAKEALGGVEMHPRTSVNRMLAMLDTRDDWALVRQHGSGCWWELPVEKLLPPSLSAQADLYVKGSDTMDVWFDSGSSWATVLGESGYVADMYLEGSDQHRGWFQSSLLTSVAARGSAPYRRVVTHGFVLDGQGVKMSKSLGNVISPADVVEGKGFGTDVLRLWVASSDFTSDVSVSDGILRQTNEVLQKVRNTCRFALGNLGDYDHARHSVPYSELSALDRYTLHLLSGYCSEAHTAYDSLNFSKIYHLLVRLVPVDLSAFYFDVVKDRLYCESEGGRVRRSTQTALHHVLGCLTKSVAPIAPHLAEEIAQHYPFENGSVFKAGWEDCPVEWHQPSIAAEFGVIRSVRDITNKALDQARSDKVLRSSLEAQASLRTDSSDVSSVLTKHLCPNEASNEFALSDLLLVSHIGVEDYQVGRAGC
ncbi:hypothetical protein EMCRGX_G020949 [Ephydatia muelleri]